MLFTYSKRYCFQNPSGFSVNIDCALYHHESISSQNSLEVSAEMRRWRREIVMVKLTLRLAVAAYHGTRITRHHLQEYFHLEYQPLIEQLPRKPLHCQSENIKSIKHSVKLSTTTTHANRSQSKQNYSM